MQAYQSAPCPYCGVTWNEPGAQTCANCRNPLPPPQASYTPPGYSPGAPAGPPQSVPGQAPGYPYGAPNYPPQQAYPQAPSYPGAPAGYPGQAGPGGPPPQYPSYAPPAYAPPQGYPPQPGAYGQAYPSYAPPAAAAPAGTTLRVLGQTFTVPVVVPPGELPDIADVGVQDALAGSAAPLQAIAGRYGTGDVAVAKLSVPGDRLDLHVTVLHHRSNVWKLRGEAKVDGAVVAEAEFMASIQNKPTATPPAESSVPATPSEAGS